MRADLSQTEIATLLAVASMTKPVGPSTQQVAQVVGVSRVSVRRAAKRLAAAGVLVDDSRAGGQARLNLTPQGQRLISRIKRHEKGTR